MRRGAWCSLSSFHVAGAPIHRLPSLTRNGAEKIEVSSPGGGKRLLQLYCQILEARCPIFVAKQPCVVGLHVRPPSSDACYKHALQSISRLRTRLLMVGVSWW